MFDITWQELGLATWQTIYMVFIASFIGIVAGLLIGLILYFTQGSSTLLKRLLNYALSFVVNIGRSVPYIILMIAIIPLTRWVVGTSIGTNAAIVSLVLAAIPFYARIAEAAFEEVSDGLLDASLAMGATTGQIIRKVLIPESLPSLIKGGTLTVIALIGYSAMAGAVGGGGLGQLAINYGYQQFNVGVMLMTVIILVVLVQLVQSCGDAIAGRRLSKPLWILSVVLWALCIGSQVWPGTIAQQNTLKIGITSGVQQRIMAVAQQVAQRRYHLHLQIITFDDYNLPNIALNNGAIDANIFQHIPFLDAQVKAHGYHIVPLAKTFVYPMGVFSKKITHLSQLPDGALVAIPNDPSNEGRALLLLEQHHLIKLKPQVGVMGTVHDIIANPDHLRFQLINAAQIPRALPDVTLAAINNDFVKPAGLKLSEALFKEGPDAPYANIIAVRKGDHNPLFKQLIAVMHSKAVLDATLKAFPDGAAIATWPTARQTDAKH
jgi:D-methionine transport system permease protein